jgi:hypothetical protein
MTARAQLGQHGRRGQADAHTPPSRRTETSFTSLRSHKDGKPFSAHLARHHAGRAVQPQMPASAFRVRSSRPAIMNLGPSTPGQGFRDVAGSARNVRAGCRACRSERSGREAAAQASPRDTQL